MATRKEPTISEQQAQEIVERMSRREYRSEKSLNNFYKNTGLNPTELEQPGKCVTEKTETAMVDEPSNEATEEAAVPQKRISSKQRRLSLDEYRTTYLQVPQDCRPQARVCQRRGARQLGQDSPLLRRQGYERIGNGREPCPPAP